MNLELREEQRQLILLAIGELALRRPGWDWTLGELAEHLGGREMFERFKHFSNDMVTAIGHPEGDMSMRHRVLHAALDELLTCWLVSDQDASVTRPVLDLLKFSFQQTAEAATCSQTKEPS